MANKLGSFAIIGLRNMRFYDNQGKLVTALKHLKDIDISNESSTTYLRGGEGNKKLLAISGDDEATVTSNQATMTTKLFEIITGNKMTEEDSKIVNVEEELSLTSGKATLKNTLVPGGKLTVFKVDEFGRDTDEIILGDPTAEATQYSIEGQVLTLKTDLKHKIRVYFPTTKKVEIITSKPATALNYKIESDMICKDVGTKEVFLAKLVIPNGQIQKNFSITGSNESTEPAAIPLAIDCLEDGATGKFYEILFYEDDKKA